MRLRRLLCSAVFVFALVANAMLAADTCSVTTPPNPSFGPPAPYPPNASQSSFWYGTPGLWANLPNDGVWHGLLTKLFLWQQRYDWRKEEWPDIIVVLRRVDVKAPLVSSRGGTNAFIERASVMLTGFAFPSTGCWEITSYHDGHMLSFVASVQP